MLAKVVVLRRICRLMIVVGGGMTATPMSMPSAVNVVLRALRIVLLRSSTATVACLIRVLLLIGNVSSY